MKAGSSLATVAERVQAQRTSARDFLARPSQMSIRIEEDAPRLVLNDGAGHLSFSLSDVVHEQLATVTGIPSAYYRRLHAEIPELLAINATTLLSRLDGRRLVRTVAGANGRPVARAVLSDRFRPLDNYDLLEAILPTLAEHGVRVESCELTERRLYIKAVSDRFQAEVKPGDVVQGGVLISNSDVGCGALSILPLMMTLRCTNGLVLEDTFLRRHHVGRRHDGDGHEVEQLLSDEARQADDRAFFLRVRDVVRGTLDEVQFKQRVSRLRVAGQSAMEAKDVPQVLEVSAKRFGLIDQEAESVLAHLIGGGDLSQWGLASAITRAAQDVGSYDRSTELERIGGRIIALNRVDWASLASAN